MTLPGFYVTEEELSLNVPQDSDLIVGVIGPASKGPVDEILDFNAEPNFVARFGKPVNREYAVRAGIRFLQQGSRLKFVRVAGSLLSFAEKVFYGGGNKILTVKAASPGSWSNGAITIGITHTDPVTYNVRVYENGRAIPGEFFVNVTNGDVEAKINGKSAYITVVVESGAGTTPPDETRDVITGALSPEALLGGDDGAFASTRSPDSSTGGIAGKRFYGMMDTVAGSRTWFNLLTIGAALAGSATYRGTVNMPVQPGTFTVRVQTAAGPTFVELTDDEDGTLLNGMAYSGVGLLRDATSTHLGYINYRTGAFGVKLVGGPALFNTGTIDAIWIRARADSVGTTLAGLDNYTGALSAPTVCPGSVSTARAQLHIPADDRICTDSGLAAAQHDSADANCQPMDGYILPGTVSVTAPTSTGTQTVYDDGFGGWRTAPNGGGTVVVGSFNYRTGAWDITFPANVPANSAIDALYTFLLTDAGSNALAGVNGQYIGTDVVCTNAVGGAPQIDSADANCAAAAYLPVVPGSVRFVCSDVAGSPVTVYDDGQGGLCTKRRGDPNAVDVVGSIDYTTGAWDITFSGNVTAAATITASYVNVAESNNVHALRGADTRIDNTDPATANNFKGLNWIDYSSGSFRLELVLSATRDLQNNGAIYAVYQHGTLFGWGDGTTTAFTGTVEDAPIRRENNRMLAFQAGQQALPGTGETQVALAKTGVLPTPDSWQQNVGGGATANALDFAAGGFAIQWTAAPYNGEALFVVAEEIVGHVTCKWTGSIGNERAVLTDGMYCKLEASPLDATKMKFSVWFNDGTGTAIVESWDLLTDFNAVIAKVNATDGTGSNVVLIENTGAGTQPDTVSAQSLALNGAFDNADVVGTKVGPTYTGLQLFSNLDVVAVDVLAAPGQWHRQVISAGIVLCETAGRRASWVTSIPDFTPPAQMSQPMPGVRSTDLAKDATDFVNGNYNALSAGGVARPTVLVPYPPLSIINSDYAVSMGFYIKYLDQYANEEVWEAPEGDYTQLVAKTDRNQERWFPVAGGIRGKFREDVTTVRYAPDVADRTKMYEFDGVIQNVVNPIRYKVGFGIFLDGQRTMLRPLGGVAQARDRQNVRLMLNKLENLLELANLRYGHELNDPILWRQVQATGRQIVRPMIARRGLIDANLVCDETTNTPEMIDQYKCVARLMLKPTKAAEIIQYNVIIVPTGVSFEEVLASF